MAHPEEIPRGMEFIRRGVVYESDRMQERQTQDDRLSRKVAGRSQEGRRKTVQAGDLARQAIQFHSSLT